MEEWNGFKLTFN